MCRGRRRGRRRWDGCGAGGRGARVERRRSLLCAHEPLPAVAQDTYHAAPPTRRPARAQAGHARLRPEAQGEPRGAHSAQTTHSCSRLMPR